MARAGDDQNAAGAWSLTIPLAPGSYGYKFLVNGSNWLFDPENPNRKTVNGVDNSAIEIGDNPASAASVAPTPAAATNTSTLQPTPAKSSRPTFLSRPRFARSRRREGTPKLTTTHVAISVSPSFDPAKSWPILLINNTENYPNIDSLHEFKDAANAAGWIALAGDPTAEERSEDGGWRSPCSVDALDALAAAWPGAEKWPVVCGGMSGGAKNSAFVAGAVAKARYHLIGMLMMGCNQDIASVELRKGSPPNFLGVPVLLSSGEADTIATPEMTEYVEESLRHTGSGRCAWKNTTAPMWFTSRISRQRWSGSSRSRAAAGNHRRRRPSTPSSRSSRSAADAAR